jgi:hypothetical protein
MLAMADFEFCIRSEQVQRLHLPNPSEYPSHDSLVLNTLASCSGTCTPAVMHASVNVAADPADPFRGDICALLCKNVSCAGRNSLSVYLASPCVSVTPDAP